MKKQLKKLVLNETWGSAILAIIITFALLGAWFTFSKVSLGIDYNPANWDKANLKKNSVIDSRVIILNGTDGASIVFGTTTGQWVGTPTDSTLAKIGLNTGTGKLEFKNAGTETASPIVKYHDDLFGVTANQHHNKVHGTADHSGNIGTESQIAFGTGTGHAHTGTDSTKLSYPNLLNRSHGSADHTGNIGTESQITFGTQSGHAHTGTDSTKINYSNLLNRSHGAADHSGNIGTESQIAYGTQSGHAHNGVNSTKIDYATAPVRLGTDTTGNTDNISEGIANLYHTTARVNAVVGSSSVNIHNDTNITFNEGDYLKISGGQVVAGSSSTNTPWSGLTGKPTDNGSCSVTAAAGKIPVADSSGKIVWNWLGGITGSATTSIGTTTQIPDSTCILLLHMDGTNGATTFTNSGYGTMSITAQGNAQISTAAAKFGVSSGLFDGNGDYLTLQTSPLFTIPAGSTWDFSVQTKPTVVNSDDGIFAMGTNTDSFSLMIRASNMRMGMGTQTLSVASPSAGVWTQIYVSYDGKIGRLFYGGTQQGTVTVSDTYIFNDNGEGVEIGAQSSDGFTYEGNLDEVRFRVNPTTNFRTSNFTSETSAYTTNSAYTENTLTLLEPNNNIPLLKFISPGTATAEKTYTFLPGSVTVFGGTSTGAIGTTTPGLAYGVPGKGASTFDAQNIHSIDEIKAGMEGLAGKENEQRNKLLKMNSKSWHPKLRDITLLDAENQAKAEYLKENFSAWEILNKNKYLYAVEQTGTGTVSAINTIKMLSDYTLERELLWASDLNQSDLIKEKQGIMESDVSITRLGFRVKDSTTPSEIIEGDSINIMSLLTLTINTVKAQDAEIGSLTTALTNQKIAYNEEIDNIYNLINMVILGLVGVGGVGGVGGWATMRRKRKGT